LSNWDRLFFRNTPISVNAKVLIIIMLNIMRNYVYMINYPLYHFEMKTEALFYAVVDISAIIRDGV